MSVPEGNGGHSTIENPTLPVRRHAENFPSPKTRARTLEIYLWNMEKLISSRRGEGRTVSPNRLARDLVPLITITPMMSTWLQPIRVRPRLARATRGRGEIPFFVGTWDFVNPATKWRGSRIRAAPRNRLPLTPIRKRPGFRSSYTTPKPLDDRWIRSRNPGSHQNQREQQPLTPPRSFGGRPETFGIQH